jgi:outer membrane protein insertion porin family
MKLFTRLFGIWLLFGCAQLAWAQDTGPKVERVDIKYVGPASVSEQFVRANIRLKAGDIYHPNLTEDDIHSLYGTGQFNNIRVSVEPADDGGLVVTYTVQARLRITDIKITGNKDLSSSKLKKKITVKTGEPLDEQKLFTDVQEMKKLYEKYGYPDTQVKYVFDTFDEAAGRASVTFQVVESQKIKILRVEFIGASAFPQKELGKQIKTRAHWMFSWLTGGGVFKKDEFDDDKDALTEYYRNHGYLDFEIKDVTFEYPFPNMMLLRFFVYEGKQYKMGAVTFSGTTLLPTNAVSPAFKPGPEPKPKGSPADAAWLRSKKLNADFKMKTGSTFTPDGLSKDMTAIEDFYGSQGYIDVQRGPTLRDVRIPNVDTGTMDLGFRVDEGQKAYVEQINIRGNIKTKDKVIRRELAIAPGEVFDMVRVKTSKQRLEGLDYFDKVDLQPEPTDPPIAGRKNLDVNVEEKDTGKFTLGAGFSSVDALVGFAEISQGNFDLFHPPYFTGGGQKLRLFIQLGTERQDYELSFIEPWFLNRKLALGVDLYRHEMDYESPNNIYNETRTGTRLSLTRALGSDFLIGSVSYTVEDVGISLNDGWHDTQPEPGVPPYVPPGRGSTTGTIPFQSNVPGAIFEQTGDHLFQRFGASLAYDTRNSNKLPNHGQRTELDPELSVGNTIYYKIEAKTAWYFPGLFKGHVLEADGRAGLDSSLGSGDVPFYDREYLGGLYSLRGFKYRNIAPRDPTFGVNQAMPNEPIGGDSFWYGSLEYSIPILEKENGPSVRFALFYDAGAVGAGSYSFSSYFDDDAGIGLRLDIPHLGPLRLDYGIPITHDQYNGSSGKFQFGVGYTREF